MLTELQNATDRLSVNLTPTTTLTAKLAKVEHYFLCVCFVLSFFLSFFLFHFRTGFSSVETSAIDLKV